MNMDSTLPIDHPSISAQNNFAPDAPAKRTKSDRESSLSTNEFLWDTVGLTAAGEMIVPALLKRVRSLNPKRILDLGCGNGSIAASLANHGFSVSGTDMSASGMAI